jgi:hypothetical protein
MNQFRFRVVVTLLVATASLITVIAFLARSGSDRAFTPPTAQGASPGAGNDLRTEVGRPDPAGSEQLVSGGANSNVVRARQEAATERAVAFTDWLTTWRRADAAGQASLVDRGRLMAAERRSALKQLIAVDPKLALSLAVPVGLRAELPPDIQALLEQRIDARGNFEVLIACGPDFTRTDRSVVIAGEKSPAFSFGRREQQATKYEVPLHGIAIDGTVALDEAPLRIMDDAERSQRGLPAQGVAVLVGGETQILPDLTAVASLERDLVAAEAQPGPNVAAQSSSPGATAPDTAAVTSPPSWINGEKRVLWVKVDFSDAPGAVATDAEIATTNTAVTDFYRVTSYGKTGMTFTTLPAVLRLPKDKVYYNGFATSYDEMAASAKTLAKQYDTANGGTGLYDPDRYDRWIVLYSKIAVHSFSGLALLGGPQVWMHGTIAPGTVAHELGHTESLSHSHFWLPSGTNALGAGAHVEYGDVYDVMGTSGSSSNNVFNVGQKAKLGYLEGADITTATQSGTYRITRHDHRDSAGVRALKIAPANVEYEFWLEYRQTGPTAFNGAQLDRLRNGVLVHWGPEKASRYATGSGSYLIDATPNSAGGANDAALRVGETLVDPDAGITLKPLATGGSAPNEYIDVQVNFGGTDGNRNPVLAATAPAGPFRARTSLVFNASASDPDGDPLYFRWDLGDGKPQPTQNSVTARYSKGGAYTVRISAHDGKGGIDSKSFPLTVADPLIEWTQRGATATTSNLYGVIFAGRQFVATGDASTVLTSPNGIEWTRATTPTANNFYRGVAHNGTRYVVAGLGPGPSERGAAAYSDDGVTWTAAKLPANVGTINSVAWGVGQFVAVGESGRIYASADGTAWTDVSSPVTSTLWSVACVNNLFVVSGASGRLLTSSDGLNWTNRSVGTSNTLGAVTYHDGAWYASSATAECFTSPDGGTWTRIATAGRTNATLSLISTSGVLLATTTNGSIAFTEQPRDWVIHQIDSTANTNFNSIAEANGLLVMVGSRGLIYSAATAPIPARPLPAPLLSFDADSVKVSVGKKNILAASGAGFAKLELYANGIKVSEINGAGGAFTWTPGALGRYSLVVRGIAASGETAVSQTYQAQAGVPRWSWRNPTPVGVDLTGAVRANGKWWMVGHTGALVTLSDDGKFDRLDFPTTQNLSGISYANGLFVIAANYFDIAANEDIGPIWTSRDGYTWNLGTSAPLSGRNINFITYAQEKWLIGSISGVILTSGDGLNWTAQQSNVTTSIRGAAFGNGLWVAVTSGGKIITSPDAIRWTERASGVTTDLTAVAFNNGVFAACGASGIIVRSPDGITWTRATSGTTNALNHVGVFQGTFVIAGDGGITFFSTDGAGWTRASMEGKFSNSLFVATAADRAVLVGRAGEVFTSNNPGAWQRANSGSGESRNDVLYAGGRFVAVSNRTDPIANTTVTPISTSPDGVRWTRATGSTALNAGNFISLAYAQNTYVTVGDSGRIFTSANAVDWNAQASGITTTLLSVAGSATGFVAVGNGGAIVASANGQAWETRSSGLTSTLNSVTYGQGRFVAVGNSGAIVTSTDGVTWTAVPSGVNVTLITVRWFDNIGFLVGGNSGVILNSADGITWQQGETGTTAFINTLAATPVGILAGAGLSGTMLLSLDGNRWTNTTYPVDRQMNGLAANATTIVSVGTNGAMVAFDLVDTAPPPVISAAPAPQVAAAGGTAVFQVEAQNTGGAVYQWFKDGAALPGANSPILTLTGVNTASLGAYAVSITTPTGSVKSSDATLVLAAANQAGRLVNLSLLTALSTPGESFTMGAVIGGSGTSGAKPVLVRAVGPSLSAFGVSNGLRDPTLEFFAGPTKIGENDNWGGSATLRNVFASVGAFPFADGASLDAAIYNPSVAAGNNSIKVSGVGAVTGAVLAELYDATPTDAFTATTPRLINVSVLKHLGSGLTAGFVVGGSTPRKVLVRAIGPTLGAAPFNVGGVVADPQLTLYSGSQQIGENNDWGGTAVLSAAFSQVGAFALPASSKDAALQAELPPGSYTVQVSGVGGTTGVALVEVYEVP